MGRHKKTATLREETRVDAVLATDELIELTDKLMENSSKALALDYEDDAPRSRAMKVLTELRGGFYGLLSDAQCAEVALAIKELEEQEKIDLQNDALKQEERSLASLIKGIGRKVREHIRISVVVLAFFSCGTAQAEVPDALAVKAIMGEASNQGYEGMVAVGEAIRNRGTLKGVYGVKAKHIYKEPAWVWNQAEKAWRESAGSNLVKGADHWENTTAFGTPYWAKSMVVTAKIKDHTFYRKPNR